MHFRLQYAALALVVFVLFALARRPVWAAIALGIAVANGLIAAPLVVSRPAASGLTEVSADDGVPVRLAFVNVFFGNDEYRRVLDFVRAEQPDAIVFAEVDEDWLRELDTLKKDYPNAYGTRGKRGRGLLLLSRLPMEKPAVIAVSNDAEPALGVTLSVQGKPLHLLGVHANWPFGFGGTSRNQQLAELAAAAQAAPRPLVVLGDLNVSPFSSHFQTLLRAGNLQSAAAGFGWQPTWPEFMPPAGIQIDHVLVSPGVQVRDFRRGSQVGSDHLPVVVDLAL